MDDDSAQTGKQCKAYLRHAADQVTDGRNVADFDPGKINNIEEIERDIGPLLPKRAILTGWRAIGRGNGAGGARGQNFWRNRGGRRVRSAFHKAEDSLEFILIEPGSVLLADVYNQGWAMLEVFRVHPMVADWTLHRLRRAAFLAPLASGAETSRRGIGLAHFFERLPVHPNAAAFGAPQQQRFAFDACQRRIAPWATSLPAANSLDR